MHTVEMSLPHTELPATMAQMRMWLDERRFEPSVFCCHDHGTGVLIRVDFKVTGEAEAFADRFRGRLDSLPSQDGQDYIRDISSALSPEGVVGGEP
jgi:hypothetical protein